MLQDARRQQFDVVVAEGLDRLSRDQEHVAALSWTAPGAKDRRRPPAGPAQSLANRRDGLVKPELRRRAAVEPIIGHASPTACSNATASPAPEATNQGDAIGQHNLGWMYDNGQGVPQDNQQAVAWFRKAADQGYADAQNDLGLMYANGQGVPQDYVRAHMWLNLAAARSDDATDQKVRDDVAAKMTPAQIAEAQRMVREWTPK